jgi:hypothetical protein
MRIGIALLSLALGAAAPPAGAQVINSPEIITKCLCAEQLMTRLHETVDTAQRRYDDEKGKLDVFDAEIAVARSHEDVNNPEQVEALRQLNLSRGQSFATLNNTDQPHLIEVTTRLNLATDRFNSQCAGQNFDLPTQEQIRSQLSCPIEEPPTGQSPR